ncbi:MAG: ATP-binding cassette domain-containing protein [Egibacteraceae bacterium]
MLSVRGLRKRFGQLQVLQGVDLEVGADELVALVGENGAGKSTVVKCVARAVAADAGSVLIGGVSETRAVEQLIRRLRDQGVAVLLISQRIEQVCNLADRIVVLRGGRIVADVSPLEVHPDDVVALMSGTQIESTARRQLQRLRSLADQLSEAAPSASLPLIVSAMAAAIGQEQLCVHLLDPSADRRRRGDRRRARASGVGAVPRRRQGGRDPQLMGRADRRGRRQRARVMCPSMSATPCCPCTPTASKPPPLTSPPTITGLRAHLDA